MRDNVVPEMLAVHDSRVHLTRFDRDATREGKQKAGRNNQKAVWIALLSTCLIYIFHQTNRSSRSVGYVLSSA